MNGAVYNVCVSSCAAHFTSGACDEGSQHINGFAPVCLVNGILCLYLLWMSCCVDVKLCDLVANEFPHRGLIKLFIYYLYLSKPLRWKMRKDIHLKKSGRIKNRRTYSVNADSAFTLMTISVLIWYWYNIDKLHSPSFKRTYRRIPQFP